MRSLTLVLVCVSLFAVSILAEPTTTPTDTPTPTDAPPSFSPTEEPTTIAPTAAPTPAPKAGLNDTELFALLLTIILFLPPIVKVLRVPGLVGLVLGGLAAKESGILDGKDPRLKMFSSVGKIYLMFMAGLEVDMDQFRKAKARSAWFGWWTHIIPLSSGMIVGKAFGYGWIQAVFIGSLLASHTLLAYPIISRAKVLTNEAIVISIGGVIFTDTAALILLAVCVELYQAQRDGQSFNPVNLLKVLGFTVVLITCLLIVWRFVSNIFYTKIAWKDEHSHAQFIFAIATAFYGSYLSELLSIEPIVGAFMAGLAINEVMHDKPHVAHTVVFVGQELFFPIFFIELGTLVEIQAFGNIFTNPAKIGFALSIVTALIGSKGLAALVTCRQFRYSKIQFFNVWALSLPQVAATLAACLVGVDAGLGESDDGKYSGQDLFNSVILLMLTTAVLGPLATNTIVQALKDETPETQEITDFANEDGPTALLAEDDVMAKQQAGNTTWWGGMPMPIDVYDLPNAFQPDRSAVKGYRAHSRKGSRVSVHGGGGGASISNTTD
jgi:Kef-type K+ transport system membrane component KefB